MPVFTVHVPSGIADPVRRAERTVFLREGFSWSAFLFGPLALLYRRLWLAALCWVVLAGAIVLAAFLVPLPPVSTLMLFGLLALLTGLEARTLEREALGRRRFGAAALLTSPTRDEAERRFFGETGASLPRAAAQRPAADPRAAAPRPRGSPEVIGLFPEGP